MRRLVGAIAAISLTAPAVASAETRLSMDIEADVGFDTNPFLAEGGNTTGTASLTLTPQAAFIDPTGQTLVVGRIGRVEYFKDYDAAEIYSIGIDRTQQFSEKLSGTAHIGAADTSTALLNPVDEDGLTRNNNRRRSYDANGSLNYLIDERNTVFVSAYAQKAEYPGRDVGLGNYDTFGGTVGYSRSLNARTSVGFTMGASKTNADTNPDSTSYQPQLTLKHQFNSVWLLDTAVGIIFQDVRFGGTSDSSRSLGLQFSLCGTYPLQTICVTASRDSSASGYGGPRIRTNFGASYSRKLSERSRLNFNGVYVQDKSAAFAFTANKLRYITGRAEYEHDLRERLAVGVRADYSHRQFVGANSNDSIAGGVFLRVKLGRQ